MITRSATFSPCRRYRYSLSRIWNPDKPYCFFCLLNPSTADQNQNDPTVSRCMRFASDWGYGGLMVGNLFAFRATDPKQMKSFYASIGPENNKYLMEMSECSGITVAAWGVHGNHLNRARQTLPLLSRIHYLELTKDGIPKHPLYLKANLKPIPWEWK